MSDPIRPSLELLLAGDRADGRARAAPPAGRPHERDGMTPPELPDSVGLLDDRLLAAHSIHERGRSWMARFRGSRRVIVAGRGVL